MHSATYLNAARLLALCGGLACTLAAFPASAQDSTIAEPAQIETNERRGDVGGEPRESDVGSLSLSAVGWFEHTFRTDIDDDGASADGDVAVSRVGTGLTLSGAIGEQTRWFVPLTWEYSSYDFNDAGGLVNAAASTEPFEDGHIFTLTPSVAYIIDQRWSVRGGVLLESAFEPGADFGDSLTFGGLVAARYNFSKEFALTFGVAAKSRLEDSALVIPIIGAEWTINEQLRLSGGGGNGPGSRGPGIALYYAATESLTLSFGGSYEFREFRLEERTDDASEGVFSDQRVNLLMGVEWRATESISVGLTGGVSVWQEYEFENSEGDTVHEVNGDPTGLLGVNISVRF